MTFFRIYRYDISNGLIKEYKKYILALCFFISAAIIYRLPQLDNISTLGNYILFTHVGMMEYSPDFANRFQFPTVWICFHMLEYFIVLYYPYDDMNDFGKHVLINSKNRTEWYLSKCCWTITSISIYFFIYIISQLVVCIFLGDLISMDITQDEAFRNIYVSNEFFLGYPTSIHLLLYVLPFTVSVTIGLLQMMLSLIIKPFYSYIVCAVILIGSAYYVNPLMIGNYAMVQRSDIFLKNGVNSVLGLILCMVISVASVIGGIMIFKRYDILNRG